MERQNKTASHGRRSRLVLPSSNLFISRTPAPMIKQARLSFDRAPVWNHQAGKTQGMSNTQIHLPSKYALNALYKRKSPIKLNMQLNSACTKYELNAIKCS